QVESGNTARMNPQTGYPGRWWHRLEDGRVQCDLCPRDCRLHEGQRGMCFVRKMEGGSMVLTTYGRSSGFCIDPVEKKPLNHFYPGTSILSFGTAGCNLACKFCQNWDISKSREMDRLQDQASPEKIADAALKLGCKSVAFTYNDPVIFAEYAMDIADACHAKGVKAVAVTAGYIHAEPRTPPATLTRAREIALRHGLRYVYTGNVHDETGGSTYCPACGNAVVVRDWYDIRGYHLADDGACSSCGTRISGRFQKFGRPF